MDFRRYAYHELAAEALGSDGLRRDFATGSHVRHHIRDQLTDAGKSFILAPNQPTQVGKLGAQTPTYNGLSS